MSPKITEKREKRQKEREREKKKTSNSLYSLYSVDISVKRQKTSAEDHSQTLSQSDLVFINPGIYIYIYIYIYI